MKLVAALLAVKVADSKPKQIIVADVEALKVTGKSTLTEVDAVPLPHMLDPITEYVVIVVGENTAAAALPPAKDQVYVSAPLAVNVILPPKQAAALDGDIVTAGVVMTARSTVAVPTQAPFELVTV